MGQCGHSSDLTLVLRLIYAYVIRIINCNELNVLRSHLTIKMFQNITESIKLVDASLPRVRHMRTEARRTHTTHTTSYARANKTNPRHDTRTPQRQEHDGNMYAPTAHPPTRPTAHRPHARSTRLTPTDARRHRHVMTMMTDTFQRQIVGARVCTHASTDRAHARRAASVDTYVRQSVASK